MNVELDSSGVDLKQVVASAETTEQALQLRMYATMLLSRALDVRMFALTRQGRVSFVVPCQGHEAAQAGMAFALRPGIDHVALYYRDLTAALALGVTAREVMLGVFARADDPSCGGRQMPEHFSDRRLGIFTTSSCVGTQIPHGVGMALASKIRHEDAVACTSFGEGATSKGDFHEGVNFAAIHKLPVIFFCENNGYAISERSDRQMAVRSVAERAAGYGIPGVQVDGNDVLAVLAVMRQAVARARAGDGPTLIDARTYRLMPHTSDDDDRLYRSAEEVQFWREHDPLERFRSELLQSGVLNAELDARLHAEAAQATEDATSFAERSPLPTPESLARHVYAEV